MPYVPYKKGTLLIPTGGTNHLFAIITDKCKQGSHLIVNFTTLRPNAKHDPSCIAEAGEHRFITQRSYALYRMADIQPADRLSRLVDARVYSTHDDISYDLLQRLCEGVEDSPFTARRIADYFANL